MTDREHRPEGTRALLARVRRIEIATRRAVEDGLSGQYHAVFKGRGMAFSEVRAYAPGDEVRTIDWNVTARMGEAYVKRFTEERELTAMVVCDLSASTDFGSGQKTKAEVAAEIAALVAFSAVANGDRVGLLAFTEGVERFVPPRRGTRHALRIVSDILHGAPRGRGTSLAAAADHLRTALRRRAIAFVLSDFLEPPARWEAALRLASRKHEVVAVRIGDRLERELPAAGLSWIEDPETGETFRADLSDRRVRERFARAVREADAAVERALARMGVDLVSVAAGDPHYARALAAFFRRRARRVA